MSLSVYMASEITRKSVSTYLVWSRKMRLGYQICIYLFVCFITKSFLTYSYFPPTPALSNIYRPLSSSMCSITPETANVCSSYNRMHGPGIACWFSDRSNCSHWSFEAAVLPNNPNIYTDQWEPIVMYHSITFTLLALIQLCSPRCCIYQAQLSWGYRFCETIGSTMNVMGIECWQVNISTGNVSVPRNSKQSINPMFTPIYDITPGFTRLK